MPQTRPFPHPDDPVAPASPGTLPKTDEPTRRCPPGRCARVDAAPMADIVARCAAREVPTPMQYVARWTEVAVVARERGHLGQTELSFDGAFVCWETRAGLMEMTRIKTNASFAAGVATLMRHGLLVPVDGAPRTAWYLGEGFWGGLLAGEELDTPVAKLVRGRRRAAERQGGPRRAGQRGSVREGSTDTRAAGSEVEDGSSRPSGEAPSPRKGGPEEPEAGSGSVENRTSDPERRNDGGLADSRTGRNGRERGGKARSGAVRERAAADGKERVTVARFVAEELPDDPYRAKIAERLHDFFGKLGERQISRSRQRGLAALVRSDLTGVPPSLPLQGADAANPRRGRCRQCGGRFELPGTGGDRGDGVCRACDVHPRTRGPVDVGSILDGVTERLRTRD